MGTGAIDVVLVDDHHLFTRGLALLLRTAADGRIRVVGTTGDASRAVSLVRETVPDVALIDLQMPRPGGLAAIAAVRRADPAVRILALSGAPEEALPLAALRAGADGYLPKTAEPDDLLHPLLSLVEGWAVVPQDLLRRLVREIPGPDAALVARLDAAECDLWVRIARGASTEDLSAALHVSPRTAKRMTAALLARIGARNRIEAAGLAGRFGLLDDHDRGASGPAVRSA